MSETLYQGSAGVEVKLFLTIVKAAVIQLMKGKSNMFCNVQIVGSEVIIKLKR